jgi:predicted molibdopterin-dependent oxidoreductase YjgC
MIALTLSISENTKNPELVLAAANLILLLGDSPEALQIPAEYSNTFGLYQMGVSPDIGPLYTPLETPGKGILEMLYTTPSPLNALYIMGEDPVVTFPDNTRIINTLKSLDFLIVQDIALTDTARLAHVVLPASSWAEKDGSFTNAEGKRQKVYRVVDPTGESLPDWQILRNLALTMGRDIKIKNLDAITQEINSLIERYPLDQGSTTTYRFNPVMYRQYEDPDSEYPLNFVIRDILHHSGSMSTRSKSLDLVVSESILEINKEDAKRYAILDNSHVKVTSKQATVYLKARISENVPEGTVFAPPHFPHANINSLTTLPKDGAPPVITVKIEATK